MVHLTPRVSRVSDVWADVPTAFEARSDFNHGEALTNPCEDLYAPRYASVQLHRLVSACKCKDMLSIPAVCGCALQGASGSLSRTLASIVIVKFIFCGRVTSWMKSMVGK